MVRLSPDGSKVAYVVPFKGKQGVVVEQLDPPKALAGVDGNDQKVRDLIWAGDNYLLIMKSQTGYAFGVDSDRAEWNLVQVLDLAQHKLTPLLGRDVGKGRDALNAVDSTPSVRMVDGRPVVFAEGQAFVDSQGVSALFSVDLANGTPRLVEQALSPQDDRNWIVDAQGSLLAQTTYSQSLKQWTLRLRRNGTWVDSYSSEASIDLPYVEGVSNDGASLILDLPTKRGLKPQTLSLADGKLGPAPKVLNDFDDDLYDPTTHRIIGGIDRNEDEDYEFLDPKDQAAWNAVVAAFPGEDVRLVSWSANRRKVVIEVTGQVHGVIYALVDLDTHKTIEVGQAYHDIGPQDVSVVETIRYKAADGMPISAYLTLPNGKNAKNLPLIVLPHGGHEARDDPGFDYWSQALASRGYAVLQPEFRGSGGFDQDLVEAGYGQFGRKMQTDLSDGVAALAKAGMIDPKRVCIVGGSYGGYAALAGVTLQTGIYRCAVSVAGISDIRKMWGGWQADPSRDHGLRYWDRYLGAKDPNDPALDQYSPIRHIDNVSVPILLIHGRDDTVVPFDQSQRMADALRAAHKSVEFVVLNNEDHWLSRAETRTQMLEAMVKFLEANNPPG